MTFDRLDFGMNEKKEEEEDENDAPPGDTIEESSGGGEVLGETMGSGRYLMVEWNLDREMRYGKEMSCILDGLPPNPANLSCFHQWRPHFLYPQLSHTLTSPFHTTTTTTTLPLSLHSPFSTLKLSISLKSLFTPLQTPCRRTIIASTPKFHGQAYVVGDNIDIDQIIPTEYLTLVPSKPDVYKKLDSFALIGSSREHALVALGAAGVVVVVADSKARIFFRNSVATGEVYPLESEVRICEECRTGDVVTIELGLSLLINHTTGKEYKMKPVGDAGPVIEAGGIFAYARKTGIG
ncbi:hypothetical protein LguiA_034119 [Lonicera macranthoides]